MRITLVDKRAITDFTKSRATTQVVELDDAYITEHPWTPVLLKEGKNWLESDNFESIELLVYDIDNTTKKQLRLDDAITLLKDYKCIIGTSRNHQKIKATKGGIQYPAADRYRVIMFLEEPCKSIRQYQATFTRAALDLGIANAIDSTQDLARFFLPCTEIVYVQDGKEIKLSLEEPVVLRPKAVSYPPIDSTIKGALPKDTLNFIAQVSDNNIDWFAKYSRHCFKLKKANYSQAEAESYLTKAAPYGYLTEEDLDQLNRIYKKELKDTTPMRLDWPEQTEITDKNPYPKPVPNSLENYKYLIQTIEKMQLRYNIRAQAIEINDKGSMFTDHNLNKLYTESIKYKLGGSKDLIASVVDVLAQENKYDPLIEAITAKPWDGNSRINELLNTLVFPDDITTDDLVLYEKFLRRWIIGIVNKIFKPGSENNMLIFVGHQGVGKTRWFRQLASIYPPGFIEAHINPDDKDCHLNLLKYFLWSVSELDTITYQKDVGALKDFITKSEVRARPAYGRFNEIGSAITSFCASVNSRDFLYDTTGNRRYLIMLVNEVNPDHGIDVQQLYAEAYTYMIRGERAWFDREEINIVNKYNERFMSRSDLLETFEMRVVKGKQAFTLQEITHKLGVDTVKPAERRAIRDWMTKKDIMEVNHSGAKKYKVDILPVNEAAPDRMQDVELKINKLKGLASSIEKDLTLKKELQ